MLQRITGRCLTSVVMTRQEAVGLIVTSPVIRPTSWNSSYISLYFWLLKALMGLVKMTRCFSLSARAMAYLRAEGNALRSKAVFLNRWVSRPFWECSQRNDNKSSQKFFWCKPLFSNVCVKAVDPFAKTLLLSDRTFYVNMLNGCVWLSHVYCSISRTTQCSKNTTLKLNLIFSLSLFFFRDNPALLKSWSNWLYPLKSWVSKL